MPITRPQDTRSCRFLEYVPIAAPEAAPSATRLLRSMTRSQASKIRIGSEIIKAVRRPKNIVSTNAAIGSGTNSGYLAPIAVATDPVRTQTVKISPNDDFDLRYCGSYVDRYIPTNPQA